MKPVHLRPRIIENIEDWPIYLLSKDRPDFIQQIDAETFEKIKNLPFKQLADTIVKTIYLERIRLKEEPWKVDPPSERSFWNRISQQLVQYSLDREDREARETAELVLQKIIHRYSEEIVGTFRISTFKFAQNFLTFLFSRLFNAAVSKSIIRGLWSGKRQLHERMNVVGDVETVRELFKHGTVVAVPTHFSNLDSILVGYAMDQIVGLPSFSYGAGLNLYNFGPAAYFMNRLGAYRLDRRKKNPIYLETLKTMSRLSIQRGVNSLFFPGGTRSRSGALEADLKMGLLGTAVEAQRALCSQGSDRKVFIVPVVINYHFVLEAPFLIEEHLRRTGKEQYIRLRDESTRIRSMLRFVWRFFSTSSDITLSIGKPIDVLGNFVDARGRSFDQYGHEIQIASYFEFAGKINVDPQREAEYTKLLADRILDRYRAENVVLCSHLIAFTVFQLLLHQHPKLDIYGILRLPPDDYIFPFEVVEETVRLFRDILVQWEQEHRLKLSPEIHGDPAEIIREGVKKLGAYHRQEPLSLNKNGDIVSSDFKVLYFYHNRLDCYGLEKKIQWKTEGVQILQVE